MDTDRPEETLDEVWFEAQHVVRSRVRHAIREHLASPVGGAGLHILSHIMRAGAVSPSELAARLDIRSSTIAAHLDRLEEAGWLRREPLPGAPNRVQATLTEAGREAYHRYLELRREVVEEFLSPLAREDRETLARIIGSALQNVRAVHRQRRAGRHGARSCHGGKS